MGNLALSKPIRSAISRLPRGRGMAGRLIARHLPRVGVFEMVGPLAGLRMQLDTSDQFQAQMACGAYQPGVVKELSKLVRPGDVVVTAGAHIGYMMLAMARLGAKVFGFECDPNLVEQCRLNIALSNVDAVLLPLALGTEDTELEMHISIHPGQSSFSIPHYSTITTRVPVRRGDRVLAELGIEKVDGLLIDVEGWECHLLNGLTETFTRHAPRWAIVECFDVALCDAGNSPQELREILTSCGFAIRENNMDLICTRPLSSD